VTIPSALFLPGVRTPTATVYLDNKIWRAWLNLRAAHAYGDDYKQGTIVGRAPPTEPRSGMSIRWAWGYNGYELSEISGEVTKILDQSYPDRYKLEVKDILWRAARANQVLATSPLNDVAARDAAVYLLTTYVGIPSSRISLPVLSASGSAWAGSEWILGTQTPVAWGDSDTKSGGTSALKAVQQIYGALGYWVYARPDGTIDAKLMERKPSTVALRVFQRGDGVTAGTLLMEGAPEREEDPSLVRNHVIVLGADTGVDGSQIHDDWRTNDTILPSDADQDYTVSNFLIEYVNESEAGAASASAIAKRTITVLSRQPDVARFRGKADPRISVGATIGLNDPGVRLSTTKHYFVYGYERELDRQSGRFDDRYTVDGGLGTGGFTTIPPPDANFSWTLDAETMDGTAVVLVSVDGSGSTSPTGEIVSYTWSTDATTYASTPDTATGVIAQFLFPATPSPINITLTVVDTTSKNDTETRSVDLTGADTQPPFQEVVSGAGGSAWYVTPDGGATWNVETANGDAIAVGTIGAGADDRALSTGGTFGLVSTRGSGGAGGLRQTLDTLATASTNLVANSGAITSNIWVNEANPARVWFAIGTAVYRSTDGGATKVAMAAAPDAVTWIMEDASVENSIFLLAGADMLNATDPTIGYAMLYGGPASSIARQFVRSRDGQVTWICYTGAPAGEALQRVENGAAADWAATDCRSLALDRQASSLRATVYAVTGDDPAQIWSFDGLTGLSAVQSTQTFPAGATVQHILGSRTFDVIYTADFDSIGAGQGAFRKYLLLADQLLLWKQLASGQQGHMLGLGSGARSVAELLMLPYGRSGAKDKIWHDTQAAGWVGITPPYAGGYWYQIAANPFAPDTWLLLGNSGSLGNVAFYAVSGGLMKTQDGTHSPLWLTTNAGATWTPIDLPSPVADAGASSNTAIPRVEWSRRDGAAWYAVLQNSTVTTHLWRGLLTSAAAAVTDTGTISAIAIVPGLDDDVYLPPSAGASNPDLAVYVTVADSWVVPSGSAVGTSDGTNVIYADYDLLSRRVIMTNGNNDVWSTADYRAAQPTQIVGAVGSVALADGFAFLGSGTGVRMLTDPFGSPSESTVAYDTSAIGVMRSDKQTHTAAAALVTGSLSVVVYSGGAWTTFGSPPTIVDGDVYPVLEVIVR
jgi:hypothetical protein